MTDRVVLGKLLKRVTGMINDGYPDSYVMADILADLIRALRDEAPAPLNGSTRLERNK